MYIYVCVKCERSFRTNNEDAETCGECHNLNCFTDNAGAINHSDVPDEFEIRDDNDADWYDCDDD